ncbi:ParA family protein [Jiangella asiatica]|uniref:ParA family protein n=1 Tax=Jiangella asiatica TaxID=2530372 RepID=A0A4R5DB54_9ACTN|nr:ParA family protein [Jiangella asiatica]TDE10916.1 ParA family protein [Jiangella asiatica]
MPTVSVLSLKGGVGKTSVTLGLAGAARAAGLPCVVADLDPQGNATTALDPAEVRFTANDVLAADGAVPIGDALTASGWGDTVRLLASEPALERRNHPADGVAARHRLRTALGGLRDVDLVLLDCPPSLAELTSSALAASDVAVVVAEPTAFALTGAQQALAAVDTVRRGHNLRLRPAGIVVNRYRTGSAEHRYRLDELIAVYRDLVLDPVVPERSAVSRAQGACLPIQRWPSPGAREVGRIFAGYLELLLTAARSDAGPFAKGAAR